MVTVALALVIVPFVLFMGCIDPVLAFLDFLLLLPHLLIRFNRHLTEPGEQGGSGF